MVRSAATLRVSNHEAAMLIEIWSPTNPADTFDTNTNLASGQRTSA